MGSDIGLNENGFATHFRVEIYLSGDGIILFMVGVPASQNAFQRFSFITSFCTPSFGTPAMASKCSRCKKRYRCEEPTTDNCSYVKED